jgi:hypothetical protein
MRGNGQQIEIQRFCHHYPLVISSYDFFVSIGKRAKKFSRAKILAG